MKALGLLDRLTGYASNSLAFIGAVGMVLMVLHVVIDVTGRFVFNHPLTGTLETVTYYYMVMVTVLPFAYVTRRQGQIVVELFTSWLPARWLGLLEAGAASLMLVFLVVLTWKTGQEAIQKTLIGEVRQAGDGDLIAWPSRWFLPLGAGTMACAVALRIVEDFRTFLGR
jgi:TRAP-type C4-dicarboxylate transport system permease small subunit